MSIDLKEIGTAAMVLFAVIDIVGSIPVIINIKQKAGKIKPLLATVVSFTIMYAFLFIGESILGVIGINVNSFAVAGSLVLFFVALEMVMGIHLFKEDEGSHSSASVVPIAFPLIAGAGSMTTIISIRAEFETINIVIALALNMVLVYLVLRLTNTIERLLGAAGIAILRKVFGIILLAIAVKLFSSNIQLLFQ